MEKQIIDIEMVVTFLSIIIPLGGVIFLIIKSLVTIEPDEDAVVVRLGKPVKIIKSGLHFLLWPFYSVVRYTKQIMIFSIDVENAMAKNGIVKNYKEDGIEIERTEIDVSLTLSTYFDSKKLITTLINAPGNTADSLRYAIGSSIISVVRSAVSDMPWPLFNGDRLKVAKYIMSMIIPDYEYYNLHIDNKEDTSKPNVYSFKENVITSDTDGDIKKSPFVQFGLDLNRTSIEIRNINFSDKEMRETFNAGETARMRAEKTKIDAHVDAQAIIKKGEADAKVSAEKILREAEAISKKILNEGEATADIIKKKGAAEAEARKLMINEIKDNPDLEYLKSLVEMAKGTSNTILYQIPKAFEEKLSLLLGGSTPENFFSLLKDEKILEIIKKEIEKKETI